MILVNNSTNYFQLSLNGRWNPWSLSFDTIIGLVDNALGINGFDVRTDVCTIMDIM